MTNFAEQFAAIVGLDSMAFCVSDENGFVDAADFDAMAINFEIERDMLNMELDMAMEQNAWIDELEARNREMDMVELGLKG